MKCPFRTALMHSIRDYHVYHRTDRADASALKSHDTGVASSAKLEFELIQTQMAQKPMLRAGVYAYRTRTRTNTNQNCTEANAAGRSIRTCAAREPKFEES